LTKILKIGRIKDMKTVYLSGPISGLRYAEAREWRDVAAESLAEEGIVALTPLRGKNFLEKIDGPLLKAGHPTKPLSTPKGIVTRDRWDAMRCDVMLVNLLGATDVTIGTMIEYGWADAARNPIITVMEPEGNIHDHAFIREMSGYVVDTLEEGIAIAKAILLYG
jgi:nucleoside 2-deoxyribosyltransferase